MDVKIQKSSFRDPSGFLFYKDGMLLRQVNNIYKDDYDYFQKSGLHDDLCKKGLLVNDREVDDQWKVTDDAYKIIEPEKIRFISYPYEWSFSQLKDAALTTLKIQKISLEYGMTLKDATAYNIQFQQGKPVLIDSLSFEKYHDGRPWDAYRQFCQHFLAPLALMSYTDIRLNRLQQLYLDGIPLDLATRLLPSRTKYNFSLLMHLHLHAKAQKKYEHGGAKGRTIKIRKSNLIALIQSLTNAIENLKIKTRSTEWADYYSFTNYSEKAFSSKKEIISGFIEKIKPQVLWDLGANTGEFTQIASRFGTECIAFDIDPLAVDTFYNFIREQKIGNILPLVMDITNPSPSIGWNSKERMGFKIRPLPDTVFALALIHHLAISNNVPLARIARFLKKFGENLIIEFVPKTDSQVKKLLESRRDIFTNYSEECFIKEFERFYSIKAKERIEDSERTLFWLQRI